MKYISLFSGIGGFEVAIHKKWPGAQCLFYSEVKPAAKKVYEHHFPDHKNLGNIKEIKDRDIKQIVKDNGGCELLVGGFPCTNLSSMANISGNNKGLDGPKSGLFWDMLRVIRIAKPKYILIENNASMKKEWQKIITQELQKLFKEPIYMTKLNAADFGVQTRRRLYWTNFCVPTTDVKCIQTWDDILINIDDIKSQPLSIKMLQYMNKCLPWKRSKEKPFIQILGDSKSGYTEELTYTSVYKSRWGHTYSSDTKNKKSRPVTASSGNNNLLLDRRIYEIFPRFLRPLERERLFFLPDYWTICLKYKTPRNDVLGNTVVVEVIEYILQNMTTT